MQPFQLDPFQAFHHSWAVLTAGNMDSFNAMTVSWGGLGCLWNRPVATIYVRPNRYTYEFLERQGNFTLTFFPEEARPGLAVLGRMSGRDGDKMAKSGLTPIPFRDGVGYQEGTLTLLCRTIYRQDLEAAAIPQEIQAQCYQDEPVHRMYIGEILEIQDNRSTP